MARLLKGQAVAAALGETLLMRAEHLKEAGVAPKLAIVRLGEEPSDLSYERGALKRAAAIGVAVEVIALPETATQAELIAAIAKLNGDEAVHGVLLFRPLPKHIDDAAVRNALDPDKDIDGITDLSLAGVFANNGTGFPPCTAQACIEILDYYGISLKGARTVVIGRSLVIGKPVAMLLLQRNATVTTCHRSTRPEDLKDLCRAADILLVAAGSANRFGSELATVRQTIVDVGIHVGEDGKLCGDVDFAAVEPLVGAITPVPGGVGSVTTAVLMKHVIAAAEKRVQQQ